MEISKTNPEESKEFAEKNSKNIHKMKSVFEGNNIDNNIPLEARKLILKLV